MSATHRERPSTLAESLRRVADLTPAQRTALTCLAGRGEPVTAASLADEIGVQSSSVRETLDALRAAGLVTRRRMPATGRGRPSWGYIAITPTEVDAPVRMLVESLAATVGVLRATHPDPEGAAHAIGAAWAQDMMGRDVPDHEEHPAQAYAELALADHMGKIALFASSMGFGASIPRDRPTSLSLRSCPFVSDGTVDPLVCRMHLGMFERIIDLTSHDRVATTLVPWATRATCEVDLVERDDAR